VNIKNHTKSGTNKHSNTNKINNCNIFTLNNISVCQSCKNKYNSTVNIPYLFQCGHFFCKKCLLSKFLNTQNKIECPEDGLVCNNLKEMKVLSNLIIVNETAAKETDKYKSKDRAKSKNQDNQDKKEANSNLKQFPKYDNLDSNFNKSKSNLKVMIPHSFL